MHGLIQQHAQAGRGLPRNRQRVAIAGRVDDGQGAIRVRDQLLKRAGRKPRIEQERDRPRAHRAEKEFDEFQPVADQHGDALARPHAAPRQHPGDAIHALVELAIGRPTFAPTKQVDNGNLVR